jgi:hypothetical protein
MSNNTRVVTLRPDTWARLSQSANCRSYFTDTEMIQIALDHYFSLIHEHDLLALDACCEEEAAATMEVC